MLCLRHILSLFNDKVVLIMNCHQINGAFHNYLSLIMITSRLLSAHIVCLCMAFGDEPSNEGARNI